MQPIQKISDPQEFLKIAREHKNLARLNQPMRSLLVSAIQKSPAFLLKEILELQLKPFHKVWLDWQANNLFTLILAPRGHGKSMVCSAVYSVWKIIANPDIRILLVTSSGSRAVDWTLQIKRFLTSEMLSVLLGQAEGQPWSENCFTVAWRRNLMLPGNTFTGCGVEGAITGQHVDVILIDDIVTSESARSPQQQEKLVSDYHNMILPCLQRGGEVHILGTRYSPNDFYGYILDHMCNRKCRYNPVDDRITEDVAIA